MAPDNCKDVFARLSEYLDHELPAGDCAELEEHIRDCPPCVEFVESLRKTVGVCREYRCPEPPPTLPEEKRAALRKAYLKMLERRAAAQP